MLRLLFVFLLATASLRAWAEELAVIDVRRNITLSDDDTVYKDFYISASDNSGLKKNLVVTAVRKISIRDASGSQAYGEILVPVGQLRVIATYGRVAVAREYKLLSRDELPMLEQIGIMTGDKIDLQGSFIDAAKPKAKHRVSENTPTVTTVVTTAVPMTPAISAAAAKPAVTSSVPAAAITTSTKGPSPASTAATAASITDEKAPVSETDNDSVAQKLEKTADSGNNSAL